MELEESDYHVCGTWKIPGLTMQTQVRVVDEGSNAVSIWLDGERWTGGELGGSLMAESLGKDFGLGLAAGVGALHGTWLKKEPRKWGAFWKQACSPGHNPSHNPMDKRIGEDGELYTRAEFHQFFGCQEGERQWLAARSPGTGKGPGEGPRGI